MGSVWAQRFLLAILPSMLIAGIALTTLFGDSGYLAKNRLEAQIEETNLKRIKVEREIQGKQSDLKHSRNSEKRLERTIVDEMGLVAPGTVLYTFPYEEKTRDRR